MLALGDLLGRDQVLEALADFEAQVLLVQVEQGGNALAAGKHADADLGIVKALDVVEDHRRALFGRAHNGAAGTDVTLPDLARIADVFYIGGTKVGALFGEAVVFTKGNTPKHFLTQIKQHGALLAKGWLLGLQFGTLFTDDLYLRIAAKARMPPGWVT